MILNGTSVSNGRRILTTSLAPTYALPNGRACPLDGGDGSPGCSPRPTISTISSIRRRTPATRRRSPSRPTCA